MSFEFLVLIGVGGLVITTIVHSFAGERYLLRPLFKYRGNHVLDNELARMVIRFAWHITSISWLVLAIILYALAFDPNNLRTIILISVGSSFTVIGLFDLVASKGRHIGWPLLTLIGLSTLAALFYQ